MADFRERESADGQKFTGLDLNKWLDEYPPVPHSEHSASLPDLTDEELERAVRSTEPPATPSLGGLIYITAWSLEGASRILAHVPELVNSENHLHLPHPHILHPHIPIPRVHILRHAG